MKILGIRQKRVIKLKKRNSNIGEYRKNKDYVCIIAKKNHRITEEQLKSIKIDLLTPKGLTGGKLIKFFKIKNTMIPNKILTGKGILVRMGKGKGKVRTNVLYLTQGTTCIELIPKITTIINMNVVSKILTRFCNKYTFFSFINLI